jgi:hypothetical protein
VRASGAYQPRLGGLLVALGGALLGQHLAQPGVLVVHLCLPFPYLHLRRLCAGCRARAGRALGMDGRSAG